MSVVSANGIDLHTLVLGERGPLVFMLHGLVAGSVATWYFQFAPQLSRHCRVVLFDMRGHGKSEKAPSGYDLATLATDLRDLVEHFQARFPDAGGEFHLVGHSYGALVSLYYAAFWRQLGARQPGSLFVIDAPLPAKQFIGPGMSRINDEESISALAGNIMQVLQLKGERRRRNLERDLGFLYLNSTMKADISASGDIDDASLAEISIPVTLCYGQDSDCVGVADRLQAVLPVCRTFLLPCGHYITQEAPERLRQLIQQHFEDYVHG